MSQHIMVEGEKKFVFGWDQPLQSFFLQVHDLTKSNPDNQIVAWFGATVKTKMYEIEDLVLEASRHDCDIPYRVQIDLIEDKNNGH